MAQILSTSRLASLFSTRLKKYLLFLQITNQQDILIHLLSFLDLTSLLHFLSTSSYFYKFKNIQSIEVRILRKKLDFYEKDKHDLKIDPSLFYLKLNIIHDVPYQKPEKVVNQYESLMKLIKYKNTIKMEQSMMRGEMLKGSEKMNRNEQSRLLQQYSVGNQQINKIQLNGLHSSLNQSREEQLNKYKKYQDLARNSSDSSQQEDKKFNQKSKKIVEYNSSVSKLEERFFEQAKLDYLRRKLKKNDNSLLGYDELKKMAEYDPCSRQIFDKLYKDKDKNKYQQQNISKLKMKPAPNVKIDEIDSYLKTQSVEVKHTMAGRVLIGLKHMIWRQQKL